MLVRAHWDVLIVDDEPDVLAVSRLALKPLQVYGIPLKIHECRSGAEAVEYLRTGAVISDLALAIIDVVMETEHAGLEVCKFIREELNNRVTPIVVRTGQAGKAPEREVIERYDISSYLTKVEATTEKLQITAIHAVRNYQYALIYEGVLEFASQIIAMGDSRDAVVRGIPEFFRTILRRRDGRQEQGQFHFCILTDREAITVGNFTGREADARAVRDRLRKEPGRVVNGNGDRFMYAPEHMLLSLAPTDAAPVFDLVGELNFRPLPDSSERALVIFARCLRDQMVMADRRR